MEKMISIMLILENCSSILERALADVLNQDEMSFHSAY